MKIVESFLVFFYILDQGYFFPLEENDLGGFLGVISPELWGDGLPIDVAIFYDWRKNIISKKIDEKNIIETAYDFLSYYEKEYGYDFTKTKQWLITTANKEVVKKAIQKSEIMYQKYDYYNLDK